MLFTITRDQYQKYKDTAGPCRQYILDKFSRLCSIVDTFNQYFGAAYVDICSDGFNEKSLLLTLLEDYEERQNLVQRTLTEYLDNELYANDRVGLMANLAIYVHWPSVTVTNERGQSVVVTDLYAKVPLWPDGRLYERFTLSRATYSYEQYSSGYMHSHVNGIDYNPASFMRPCLGTGPLIRTQDTLCSSADSDLWDLFCVELDRYVHVESIAGVPYRHLDQIGTGRMVPISYDGYRGAVLQKINENQQRKRLFNQFFKYVLVRKKMRFSFSNGMFASAYSDVEWILKLSKVFLKYFAMMTSLGKTSVTLNKLSQDNLLMDVKLNNGVLYSMSNYRSTTNYSGFQNLHVLYFKGQDIRTHVDDPVDYNANSYYILNPVLALAFLDQCLNYLNIYEHEKTKNTIQNNQEESESIGGTSDSPTRSAVKNSFPDYPIGEKRISLSL